MNKEVAIFGATGAQGSPVVEAAQAKGYRVRAVARDAQKVAQMHPKAQAVAADLADTSAISSALAGVDAAFLHLPMPPGPEDAQNWLKAFIGAAQVAKLPLLVFSTSGPAGERYPSSMVIDGSTAGMNAVANCGIPSIILKPAIYLENLLPPVFVPRLRSEGIADYPPLPKEQRVMWTSHFDQARLAVAALDRPDLSGRAFDIGSSAALTGVELAALLGDWLDRPVSFEPMSPAEFGDRVGAALSPGVGMALADLYGALARMPIDGMSVDIAALEETFAVSLLGVAERIKGWTSF